MPCSALWSALCRALSWPPGAWALRGAVGWSGDPGCGVCLSFIVSRGVTVGRDVLVELVAVEPNDAVAAGLLSYVERVICRPDQRLTVGYPGVRPGRDAEARRAPDRAALERKRVPLHFFTHTLGKRHSCVQHRAGQQEHELLAPIAADAVDLARLALENLRQLLEHGVAGLVAVGVVHTLELVQVGHDARDGLVQPLPVFPHLAQPLLDVPPVVEARQAVGLGHVAQ